MAKCVLHIVFAAGALCTAAFNDGARAEQAKIIYTLVAPPIVHSADADQPGYAVEIVEALAANLDLPIVIERVPLARAIRIAQAEPESLVFPITRTPTRERRLRWAVRLFHTSSRFVTLSGGPALADSARDMLIGVHNQSSWDNWLTENGYQNLYRVATAGEPIARLLIAGRIDAWYSETSIALHTLEKLGRVDVRMSAPIQRFETYLAANADQPYPGVDALAAAFAQLFDSGRYAEIMRRYGLSEQEFSTPAR